MATTLKKIVHESNVLSLSGNILTSFFGFAGFALLARTYPMEIFGEWVIFIAAASLIKMLRFGIINTALIRNLSGADREERPKIIGSSVVISSVATLIIFAFLEIADYTFYNSIHSSAYDLFFKWFPIIVLINLPANTAQAILQADQRFGKDALIKIFESSSLFLVIALNFYVRLLSLNELVGAFMIINGIESLICIIGGWDGFKYILKATKQTAIDLLQFSKYSTFTLIGTNLLRSADTFIISFSPLGTAAVALYSIPMKLTELQQVPLRSFAATAFPKLSKASIKKNVMEVKEIFYSYSGAMTYLFIGISLVTFVFADFFVMILGGMQYSGIDPVTGFNAARITQVFSFYGVLLPLDRMTGIGLDSINKPNINFNKVLVMAIANIIGDLIAVFIFKSLTLVAAGTVLFTIIGVWMGYTYLDNELSLNMKNIFICGWEFYKNLFKTLRKGRFDY